MSQLKRVSTVMSWPQTEYQTDFSCNGSAVFLQSYKRALTLS
jgi:hypothetical protein